MCMSVSQSVIIIHNALDLTVQATWPQPNPGLAPPPDIDLTRQGPPTTWTWDLTGHGPPPPWLWPSPPPLSKEPHWTGNIPAGDIW